MTVPALLFSFARSPSLFQMYSSLRQKRRDGTEELGGAARRRPTGHLEQRDQLIGTPASSSNWR
jgi:hypothetical protein